MRFSILWYGSQSWISIFFTLSVQLYLDEVGGEKPEEDGTKHQAGIQILRRYWKTTMSLSDQQTGSKDGGFRGVVGDYKSSVGW